MPLLRLDKIIAASGLYSRSEASALVRNGRVTAGGCKAVSGAEKYEPDAVVITVDGIILEYKKYRYIMLNKPAGYVSSTTDKREKTVMELLDPIFTKLGLFPAGRLDKDAEGLLLLTNDGDFAHRVTSPSGNVEKKYYVAFEGKINESDFDAFRKGLRLGDGYTCLPAVLEAAPGGAHVTLQEGKYHQVKRMMAVIGKHVTYLKRLSIGGLLLDDKLGPGQYRELGDEANAVFAGMMYI